MKRPLIRGKDFQTSIGQGEQAQVGVMGGLLKGVVSCVFFFSKEKRGKMSVWEKKLILMCERMLFMEKMCAIKEHGRNLCVASKCSGVHGRIL
jgi:hypothetical protein